MHGSKALRRPTPSLAASARPNTMATPLSRRQASTSGIFWPRKASSMHSWHQDTARARLLRRSPLSVLSATYRLTTLAACLPTSSQHLALLAVSTAVRNASRASWMPLASWSSAGGVVEGAGGDASVGDAGMVSGALAVAWLAATRLASH